MDVNVRWCNQITAKRANEQENAVHGKCTSHHSIYPVHSIYLSPCHFTSRPISTSHNCTLCTKFRRFQQHLFTIGALYYMMYCVNQMDDISKPFKLICWAERWISDQKPPPAQCKHIAKVKQSFNRKPKSINDHFECPKSADDSRGHRSTPSMLISMGVSTPQFKGEKQSINFDCCVIEMDLGVGFVAIAHLFVVQTSVAAVFRQRCNFTVSHIPVHRCETTSRRCITINHKKV